jgi:hypothetical protein
VVTAAVRILLGNTATATTTVTVMEEMRVAILMVVAKIISHLLFHL